MEFPTLGDVAQGTGINIDDVARAADALSEAGYLALQKMLTGGDPSPWYVTKVSADARRAVGQWPTAEATVDKLVAALSEAAQSEQDAGKKSKLRAVADSLGGFAREVAIHALAGSITAR